MLIPIGNREPAFFGIRSHAYKQKPGSPEPIKDCNHCLAAGQTCCRLFETACFWICFDGFPESPADKREAIGLRRRVFGETCEFRS